MTVAERIRAGVQEIGTETGFGVDVSIGIALYPEHGGDGVELLQLADRALYIAKKGGDKIHVGEEELPLDESAVSLVFQPVMDSGSNTVLGYEVLSRDPTGENSLPEFFRRYEAVGQLNELKQMILLKQIEGAAAKGLERVFINVDFGLLAGVEPPPKPAGTDIVLEFSESEVVHDIDKHLRLIDLWRREGYKFAIDDFGAGFISLPFIAQLFPDFIKMDRSTIVEAVDSERYTSFLRDMVAAMRNYSQEGIIAEGIETEAELRVANALGVDQVQGHLIGAPRAIDDAP